MFISGFATRHASRDAATDRARAARLRHSVEAVLQEIRDERDGLRRRHDAAATDAGFVEQMMDNGDDRGLHRRADVLTSSLLAYEQRLDVLSDQIEQVAAILDQVDAFAFPSVRPMPGRTEGRYLPAR